MQKLASFKWNEKAQEVTLTLRNDRGNDKVDVTKFESSDIPNAELERALQEMRTHLMQICELPDEWDDKITIRGISVRYRKGRMGIVIRGIRELEDSNTPLAINSPYCQEEWDDESEDGAEPGEAELGIFGPDCKADVLELERLVIAYFNGDRKQQVLPFKKEQEEARQGELDEELALEEQPAEIF